MRQRATAVTLPNRQTSNGATLPPRTNHILQWSRRKMSVQGQLFADVLDEATAFALRSLDPAASVEPSQMNHYSFVVSF